MRSACLILALLLGGAVAASAQCSAPCLAAVGNLGAHTYTTGEIATTGAKFIAYSLSFVNGNQPVISDNAGNSAPSCLMPESASFGGSSVICYTINPNTSNSHTFTVTGAGNIYSAIQVAAFSTANLTYSGILAGTNTAGPTTTYRPGSVTPLSTGDLVIAVISAGTNGGTALTISSGFNITGQQTYSGGTAFGAALAYLVSPAGAAVNPTWTDSQSEGAGLTVASFSQSSGSIPPPPPSVSVTSGGPAIL